MAIQDYCEVKDIEGWFPGVDFDNTTTKIKKSKIQDMITEYSAYIDNKLSKIYSVPISGELSLSICKKVCEYFTVADVNDIVRQGLGDHGDKIKPTDYRSLAEKMLSEIISGTTELTDATLKTSSDCYNYNNENSVESVIKKDEVQW